MSPLPVYLQAIRDRNVATRRMIRQWQMEETTADGIAPPALGDLDRFMEKVNIIPNGCWEWTAVLSRPGGYGMFGHIRNHKRGMCYSHRLSYSWHQGPIPNGLTIDHLCFNPKCVNPFHLEAVTQEENTRRAVARITHCKYGHEFTPENTRRQKTTGRRECKKCNARRQWELRARRRAA